MLRLLTDHIKKYDVDTVVLLGFSILIMLLAGCSANTTSSGTTSSGTEVVYQQETVLIPDEPQHNKHDKHAALKNRKSRMDENITSAKQQLSEQLNISEQDIELVSVKSVVWRDRSLGCPLPDRMYAQVLVDGYLIELKAKQLSFFFHGADKGKPFLCQSPKKNGYIDAEKNNI
ncbi:hypothetical protein [Flocculibacter collagenilyticus]|uniref:hypothetical protein n=1 Tax=Flocculibacter collagenilyticus TaxID=2744479 RepID=UPI0018F4EE0B|nr:hypothetical protein [Flocculibacter collagenilyticus]